MYRVLATPANEYDYRLVLLAAIVCAATIFLSLKTFAHALDRFDARRLLWLVLTGVCTGSGIWATHFMAVLGYDVGVPVGYDPFIATASFVIAAVASTTGFWIATNGYQFLAAVASGGMRFQRLLRSIGPSGCAAAGGAVIGAGIGMMHFTGMSALVFAGRIDWNPTLVLASLVIGIMLASAAMFAYRPLDPARAFWTTTASLIVANCAVHFTAMGAAIVIPDPTISVSSFRIESMVMAIAVAAVTAFVFGVGLVAMLVENLKTDLASHIRMLRAANADITDLNVELSDLNATLETRVAARTRELADASESIARLNIELLDKIKQLRAAQDEIVRKGKLAQLGQLTATLAHEIRNPLGVIKTAAYLVERKIKGKGVGIEGQMQRISDGIKRCDTVITELLDFARSKPLLLRTVTLDEWVRTTVEEQAGVLPSMVEVSCDLGLGDTRATFDTDRMERVLINLLSNASEAMVGKGGEGEIVMQAPRIKVTTRVIAGIAEIEVADNGPGISEENLKMIREPLYTTKSFGVGLGLPKVEKILEQHGGGLRIASKLGEGARMTAWFPVERSNFLAA